MIEQQVALRYIPRPWQAEAHAAIARHEVSVLVAHRRSGKSTLCAATVAIAALAQPGRYGIVLPTKTHGLLVYKPIFRELMADIPGVTYENGGEVIRIGSSEIIFFAGDDDDARAVRGSKLAGMLLDECQLLSERAFSGSIRPALTDTPGSWLIATGTPQEPSLLGQLFDYATTSGDKSWVGLHYPVAKTGVFTPAQIEKLRAEALNPHAFRAEFDCDMTSQNVNALIPLPAILAATKRSAPARYAHMPPFTDTPRVIAVDCGGDGLDADESAICRRWGPLVLPMIMVPPDELNSLAFKVASAAREFRADLILVDGTGGHASALIPRLQALNYDPVPVTFSQASSRSDLHNNRRSEMYARLAKFIQRPDAILPDDRLLVQELAAQTYRHDTKNRLMLEPKRKIREALSRSPDRADALAMSMLAEDMAPPRLESTAPPRSTSGDRYQSDYRRRQQAQPSEHNYDPFTGAYTT